MSCKQPRKERTVGLWPLLCPLLPFLSLRTKTSCVTWFVRLFTIGKLEGWKEKRTQLQEKAIFWL